MKCRCRGNLGDAENSLHWHWHELVDALEAIKKVADEGIAAGLEMRLQPAEWALTKIMGSLSSARGQLMQVKRHAGVARWKP